MQIDQLFDIYDPDKFDIDLGGSCVGHTGGSDDEMEYDEIRIMPLSDNNGNPTMWDNILPWRAVQRNIDLGKRATVNIDQYVSHGVHWLPSKKVFQKQVDDICTGILERARTSEYDILDLADLTSDNEPIKDGNHPSVDSYIKYIRYASEITKGYGFKLSAGGEEFRMIERRVAEGDKNVTEEMCILYMEGILQKIAIHIQGSCQTACERARWTEFVLTFQERFQIYDWIDTESNYVDPLDRFYSDWIPQIKMALDLKCDAAGFVFIDYEYKGTGTDYTRLALKKKGERRVPVAVWDDWMELVTRYKGKRKMKGAVDGMILQTLYDKEYEEINGKKYGPYRTYGYLVEWTQMILKRSQDAENLPLYSGEITGVYDEETKQAVKDLQVLLDGAGYANIDIDGKWGRKMYGWAVEVLIGQNPEQGLELDRILHKWAAPIK